MKAISVFEFCFFAILLLPLLCFLIYALSGFFINFNSLNFVFFILLLLVVLPSSLKSINSSQKKYLLLFLVANILALVGHAINGEGAYEYLRTFSGYYFYIIIGWLLYSFYYKKGKIKRIYSIFIKAGLFIATINLFQYILLITDDLIIGNYSITYDRYESIINYTTELNKDLADYVIIRYMDGRGLASLGYFYDLHSQYYFPLFAAVLAFFSKGNSPSRKDIVTISYLLTTVILSGVNMAIYSVALMVLFMYVLSENKRKYTKYVILGGFVILIWGIKKIISLFDFSIATIEILQFWDHFVSLPYKLFVSYPITFFVGGSPSLRTDDSFYSEVYWVTILYYIGLIGFFVYIKSYKTYYLSKYNYNREAFYVFLIFAFSLIHYSVYNRGVNCYASALVFMYLFVYLEKEKEIKSLNRKSKKIITNA